MNFSKLGMTNRNSESLHFKGGDNMEECIYRGQWGDCNCFEYICNCDDDCKEMCYMYTPIEDE